MAVIGTNGIGIDICICICIIGIGIICIDGLDQLQLPMLLLLHIPDRTGSTAGVSAAVQSGRSGGSIAGGGFGLVVVAVVAGGGGRILADRLDWLGLQPLAFLCGHYGGSDGV
jgi:hypothetical protein